MNYRSDPTITEAAAEGRMMNALQQIVEIDYTNWRGERRSRKIIPVRMEFGENEWHSGRQWLLVAFDDEKGGLPKTFAMSGIHSWKITS